MSSGFSRKSYAPSWVASTAVWIVPCPEIITTCACGSSARRSRSVARPSRPCIFTSRKTRWGRNSGYSLTAFGAGGAGLHLDLLVLEELPQGFADPLLVVHDQYAMLHRGLRRVR